ncbi:MAG: glutamine synthetase family protein [Pseudomonadota bacterium]
MNVGNGIDTALRSGGLVAAGIRSEADCLAAAEVLAGFDADGVETVRLVFVDQHGILRGKTVVVDAVLSACAHGIGMPSTLLLKDTAHKTVFPVWEGGASVAGMALNGASDVLAAPDLTTATPVPGSPHARRVFCTLHARDGSPLAFSSHEILARAVARLAHHGLQAVVGLEAEFQVFERIDPALDHAQASMPPAAVGTRNLTQGWQFLTDARYAEVEPLLDELRRAAQTTGLGVRTVEIEMGPSQFEFTFEPTDPMTQARRFVLFRALVKEMCHRRGLHASFMARPKLPHAAANGWHIHQSVLHAESGRNAFMPAEAGELTAEAAGWIAGLLRHAPASCLLTTPTVNGYKRFSDYQLAPNRVAWGYDNRGAMVRALLTPGDAASRLENRVADATVNPYFALAAQLLSGLDGIARSESPPPPSNTPYAETAAALPDSLLAAIEAFSDSALYRDTLGESVVDYLLCLKRAEWSRYLAAVTDWEQTEYFNLF